MSVRLDRAVTLGVARTVAARTGHLPILMYHSIASELERGVHPYYRLATHPERFAEQMHWLAERQYQVLSVEEALPLLAAGECERRRCVAVTFDDGFRDFYTAAWPVLRQHRFTATMYLPTGFIAPERKSFRGKECLNWEEVRELRAHGIRFGSHTVSHTRLYGLSRGEIADELARSRERLESELAEEIRAFAFPFAFPQEDRAFSSMMAELLQQCLYTSCVTTIIGCAKAGEDLYRLKRLPANSCDDRALFLAKLAGAYDWLGRLQSATRQLKSWAGAGPKRPTVCPAGYPVSGAAKADISRGL